MPPQQSKAKKERMSCAPALISQSAAVPSGPTTASPAPVPAQTAHPNRISAQKRYILVEKHSAASASSVLRPPPAAPRRPSRPLLMAETAVWVPYASPTHVRATASSTVDADLMVSVDGAGFASANLQDHASYSCMLRSEVSGPQLGPASTGCLLAALSGWC